MGCAENNGNENLQAQDLPAVPGLARKPFGREVFYWEDGRWKLREKKHRSKHTCAVAYCQQDRRSDRRYCATCSNRLSRANNPISYAYHNLKNRAKQRGHVFTLTFEHFREVVMASNYLQEHGRMAKSLSIDRVRDADGYCDGNIQILSVSDNVRKRFAEIPA